MVSVRRQVRITRDGGQPRETETAATEPDTEPADEEPETEPTSIEDLTQEADPETFDRTFTDADANLTIQGAFDPVAGPKQVLPRMAYVINLNYIYNPERDRWEPDKGNESSGAFTVAATGTVSADEADYPQTDPTGLTDPEANYAILPSIGDIDEWTGTGELPLAVTGEMQTDDSAFLFDTESSLMAYLHYTGTEWIAIFQVNTSSAVATVTVDYQVVEV